METVFVTVGTTRFDELVATVLQSSALKILHKLGCRHLIIQYGHGPQPTIDSFNGDMSIESFSLKNSIHEDMKKADLVISHAGSGSILESVWMKRKLIVVINERLMNNHQVELAEKMQQLNYLYFCNCENLPQLLENSNFSELKCYRDGKTLNRFPEFVDKVMGFS